MARWAAEGRLARQNGTHSQPPSSRQGRRRLLAVLLFVAAGVLVVAGLGFAVTGFAVTGFAGPAPVALVGAGGCIAGGVALWRPPP